MFPGILASVPVSSGGAVEDPMTWEGFLAIPPSEWGMLIMWVGGALFISFMCSLLEAVLMASDEFKLQAMAAKGDAGAQRMLKVKEKTEDSIAAILSLNTVAHTVGATLAGAQAMVAALASQLRPCESA